MTDKIQQARRAAFEEWMKTQGVTHVESAWRAFNAALDCVVIELPKNEITFQTDERFNIRRAAIRDCRIAITSTNLGIKVK